MQVGVKKGLKLVNNIEYLMQFHSFNDNYNLKTQNEKDSVAQWQMHAGYLLKIGDVNCIYD